MRERIAGRSPVPRLVFRMLGALYRRMTDAALAAAASAGSRTTAEHRSPSAPA